MLDTIFPIKCLGCNTHGVWLCSACTKKILTNKRQECFVCGNTNLIGNYACGCIRDFHFNGLYIAGDYKDRTLARLIKSYKYNFVKDLRIPLSQFLIDFLNNDVLDNHINCDSTLSQKLKSKDLTIIPVPIHARRLRWRGFNQSTEIAEILATSYDLPLNTNLIRTKFYRPQTKLDKSTRQKNVHNSFAWREGTKMPRNILLIDDVVTTGSTVNECARVLKENGARNVQVLVIAKR